jgi:hypothetical protein
VCLILSKKTEFTKILKFESEFFKEGFLSSYADKKPSLKNSQKLLLIVAKLGVG